MLIFGIFFAVKLLLFLGILVRNCSHRLIFRIYCRNFCYELWSSLSCSYFLQEFLLGITVVIKLFLFNVGITVALKYPYPCIVEEPHLYETGNSVLQCELVGNQENDVQNNNFAV